MLSDDNSLSTTVKYDRNGIFAYDTIAVFATLVLLKYISIWYRSSNGLWHSIVNSTRRFCHLASKIRTRTSQHSQQATRHWGPQVWKTNEGFTENIQQLLAQWFSCYSCNEGQRQDSTP